MRPAGATAWVALPLVAACGGTPLAEIGDPTLTMAVFDCLGGAGRPPVGCVGRPVTLQIVVRGENPGTGCLTLDSSVRVTVDGRRVNGSLGDEFEGDCDLPMFLDQLGEETPADIPSSQVVVEDDSATFRMEVGRLYAQRTVAVTTPAGAELHPGDHVEMEFVLPTDGETITRTFAQFVATGTDFREGVRFTLSGRTITLDLPTTVGNGVLQVGGTVDLPVERCDGFVSCSVPKVTGISVPVVAP